MKVPPKRKGNAVIFECGAELLVVGLNESPSEKEGKCRNRFPVRLGESASMKVPPKRKGNLHRGGYASGSMGLNESPSEKEGKCRLFDAGLSHGLASMKVPPKRKGNSWFPCVIASYGL